MISGLHTKFQLNRTKGSIDLHYLVFEATEAAGGVEVKHEVMTKFDFRHTYKISAQSDDWFLRYYFLACIQL